jgi:hypothetical protein
VLVVGTKVESVVSVTHVNGNVASIELVALWIFRLQLDTLCCCRYLSQEKWQLYQRVRATSRVSPMRLTEQPTSTSTHSFMFEEYYSWSEGLSSTCLHGYPLFMHHTIFFTHLNLCTVQLCLTRSLDSGGSAAKKATTHPSNPTSLTVLSSLQIHSTHRA